jgi:hypothetical protein
LVFDNNVPAITTDNLAVSQLEAGALSESVKDL